MKGLNCRRKFRFYQENNGGVIKDFLSREIWGAGKLIDKSIQDKNSSEHTLKMNCGKKLEERLVMRKSPEVRFTGGCKHSHNKIYNLRIPAQVES